MATFGLAVRPDGTQHWAMVETGNPVFISGKDVITHRRENTPARVYWNGERRALRLRTNPGHSPAEWLTVAQQFILEGTPSKVERLPHVGSIRPVHVHDVLFHTGREYIALLDPDDMVLRWFPLQPRPENRDPELWADGVGSVEDVEDEAEYEEDAEVKTETETKMDEKKGTLTRMKETVLAETGQAAWRTAATQATRAGRDLLLTGLKRSAPKNAKNRAMLAQLEGVLNTPLGEAALAYLLGLSLEIKATKDGRRKRLAQELRVMGEATAMTVLADPLREFLTTGLDGLLDKVLPAEEAVRVEVDAAKATQPSENKAAVEEHETASDEKPLKAEARATN